MIVLLVLPSCFALHEYSIFDDTSWADLPAQDPPPPAYPTYPPQPDSDFYLSIVEAMQSTSDPGFIDDFSVMPLYTLDQGSTPINTGLRSIVRNLIGNYSPVVVQYSYNNGTTTQYLREILPDYEWMFSAGIFALCLYCTFKFAGGILCKQ